MLGNTKGKLINQYVPDYVLYDLETTGTSSKYDEVIEISAVKVKNGEVTEEFSQLVNPGRPIPYATSAVNHITDDMVAFAPMFDSVLQQFLVFIGDDVLVGHNINSFDMKFLYRDCERYFGQTLTNDYIDTLKLARLCLPELSHHRLGDLAQYYGISTAGAHRALNDCRMNQQVFEKLAKELEKELTELVGNYIDVFRSAPFFIELVPKGIDKAQSLVRLLTQLELTPKDMIAFGDGYNDLSMLKLAGIGVAMANAAPEVRAEADYVTLSNEEDGVAAAIEKFCYDKG